MDDTQPDWEDLPESWRNVVLTRLEAQADEFEDELEMLALVQPKRYAGFRRGTIRALCAAARKLGG